VISSTYLQPLVNALGMELVSTRQNANQLMCIKVVHADDTEGLGTTLRLFAEAVRQQLVDVTLCQAVRLVAKTLSKVK